MCAGEPKLKLLKCSKEEAHGGGTAMGWHRAMLESMTKSRFCMIVPGDTQSSERLADAFVTGAHDSRACVHACVHSFISCSCSEGSSSPLRVARAHACMHAQLCSSIELSLLRRVFVTAARGARACTHACQPS